jgi:hypothetical protein
MIIKATIACPKHGPTKIRISGKWFKCSKCYKRKRPPTEAASHGVR